MRYSFAFFYSISSFSCSFLPFSLLPFSILCLSLLLRFLLLFLVLNSFLFSLAILSFFLLFHGLFFSFPLFHAIYSFFHSYFFAISSSSFSSLSLFFSLAISSSKLKANYSLRFLLFTFYFLHFFPLPRSTLFRFALLFPLLDVVLPHFHSFFSPSRSLPANWHFPASLFTLVSFPSLRILIPSQISSLVSTFPALQSPPALRPVPVPLSLALFESSFHQPSHPLLIITA